MLTTSVLEEIYQKNPDGIVNIESDFFSEEIRQIIKQRDLTSILGILKVNNFNQDRTEHEEHVFGYLKDNFEEKDILQIAKEIEKIVKNLNDENENISLSLFLVKLYKELGKNKYAIYIYINLLGNYGEKIEQCFYKNKEISEIFEKLIKLEKEKFDDPYFNSPDSKCFITSQIAQLLKSEFSEFNSTSKALQNKIKNKEEINKKEEIIKYRELKKNILLIYNTLCRIYSPLSKKYQGQIKNIFNFINKISSEINKDWYKNYIGLNEFTRGKKTDFLHHGI